MWQQIISDTDETNHYQQCPKIKQRKDRKGVVFIRRWLTGITSPKCHLRPGATANDSSAARLRRARADLVWRASLSTQVQENSICAGLTSSREKHLTHWSQTLQPLLPISNTRHNLWRFWHFHLHVSLQTLQVDGKLKLRQRQYSDCIGRYSK